MFAELGPLFIMLAVCLFLALAMAAISVFLGPRSKHSPVKDAPFECGTRPWEAVKRKANIRFYVIAVIFILFDIEIIFLYPWAVHFRALGLYGLAVMGVFLTVLIIGLAYEWRKGAFDWGGRRKK
jgi:NADH-quinone oxidoreductase subunit A